ncbi:MAG: hypothetical protein IJL41_03380 [Clostridia bacterium]|nr:hypothetical protein [Clostridia bacterium]
MKMGIDGKPEDLLKDEQQTSTENEYAKSEEKSTLKSKLESFWYFYKWHAIIGALLAVALVISLIQLFRNTDPDAYMMYVGPSTLYVKNKDEMTERAALDIYDYNGDGKTYVSLLEITVGMGEDMPYTAYEANVDANKRFLSELASGDSVVYLLEESFFEKANEQGLLCPLAELIDPSLLPDDMYDPCGVRVSELDYFKQGGFSSVPDDTLLCIRRSPESDSISYGRTPEYWACNKALVVKMLTYKAENSGPKEAKAYKNGKNDIVIGIYDAERHYASDGKKLAYAASSILKDANSDGKTLLAVDPVLTSGKNDAEAYLALQIAEGGEVIFIANAEYYAKLKESGILRPLAGLIGDYAERLGCEDGYGVQLKNLKWFDEKQYFSKFGKELYICAADPRTEEGEDAFYRANIDFLTKILSYKLQEEQK